MLGTNGSADLGDGSSSPLHGSGPLAMTVGAAMKEELADERPSGPSSPSGEPLLDQPVSPTSRAEANRGSRRNVQAPKSRFASLWRDGGKKVLMSDQVAHTVRPTILERTARKPASTLKGVLRFIFRKQTHVDTICDIEAKLYSKAHHTRQWKSWDAPLLPEKLFTVLNNERGAGTDSDGPQTDVIRCMISRRAIQASWLMLGSVVGMSLLTPLSFIWGGTVADPSRIPMGIYLLLLDIAMDMVFAIYLVLELNMSYVDPVRRMEVVHISTIRQHCLRSPLYLAEWASVTCYLWGAFGSSLLVNNLKFVRLWRLVKIPDPLWNWRDNANVRFFRPIVLLVICSHWVACVLACLGGYRERLFDEDVRWDGLTSESFTLYFMAFIEALYMLTGALDNPTGDGSIRDRNFFALLIVLMGGPVGCVVVSLFVANVCRSGQLSHVLEIRHEENLAFIKRALENLNVPEGLQKRVYSMHLFQKMNHDSEAFGVLFGRGALSEPLECALRVYLYNESVLFSPFFHGRTDDYIVEVVRVLVDQVFLPGDYMTRRGELAQGMYFVGRGTVSVLVPNKESLSVSNAIRVGQKRKGEFFGEVALIKECLRTAWVRADTYVVAPFLSRASLEPIWKYFPEERELLAARVVDTMERDRKHKLKNCWKNAVALAREATCGVDMPTEMEIAPQPKEATTSPSRTSMRASLTYTRGGRASVLSSRGGRPGPLASAASAMSAIASGISRTMSHRKRAGPLASAAEHDMQLHGPGAQQLDRLALEYEDDLVEGDTFSRTRSSKDVASLVSIARRCEHALEQQDRVQELLGILARQQQALEHELSGCLEGDAGSPRDSAAAGGSFDPAAKTVIGARVRV